MIPLSWPLGIGAILFTLGLFAVFTRRNAVAVFMGIELMLNAANLNFVAFAQEWHASLDGTVVVLFVILLAAAEFAVALAIILALTRHFASVHLDSAKDLKG